MKIYIRILCISFILMMFISSCKQFVQIPNAKNQIASDQIFRDSANATAALLGIYINVMGTSTTPIFINGGITINTGLSSDEIYPTTGVDLDLQYYTNKVSPSEGGLSWSSAYSWIYQANAVIEGVSRSSGISPLWKNQLIGEAELFRAFCYFHLVNLFGPVPLETSTDFKINATTGRTPVDSIYKQIVSDLLDAQKNLDSNYVTDGRVRPNKFAALSLLSKVYLYLGKWSNSEETSSRVINSGMYTLSQDLTGVFLAGSSEAIWQLIPVQPSVETAEGFAFLPAGPDVVPSYVISDYLLNSFETNDQRKVNWLASNTVGSNTYYYPYKYKLGADGNSTPVEDYMIFRLGEQYLIRSEAKAEQGNVSGAAEDLNIIRNRAGLSNTTASSKLAILDSIYHERQVELFCEGGNRWYDIKRTGLANSIMSVVMPAKGGGTWNQNWELYPVPFSEITLNPALKQNQGY